MVERGLESRKDAIKDIEKNLQDAAVEVAECTVHKLRLEKEAEELAAGLAILEEHLRDEAPA